MIRIMLLCMLFLFISCGSDEQIVRSESNQCQTSYVDGGIELECGSNKTFFPVSDAEIVDICPSGSGYIESLLLVNGSYLAFYSGSTDYSRFLFKLSEGVNYNTTDGRGVVFKIENGEIICL